MTEVLSVSVPGDGSPYFPPTSLRRSPSSFYSTVSNAYTSTSLHAHHVPADRRDRSPASSQTSSASSTPPLFHPQNRPRSIDFSRSSSRTSTPSSCISLNPSFLEDDPDDEWHSQHAAAKDEDEDDDDDDDDDDNDAATEPETEEEKAIIFPPYEDVGYYLPSDDEFDPPASPNGSPTAEVSTTDETPAAAAASPAPISFTTTTTTTVTTATILASAPSDPAGDPESSTQDAPASIPAAEDDIAVCDQPSRHVDYLSHDWAEEDVWASWRHIVSRRKFYTNGPRLENASWRSWSKIRNGLRTVSATQLNWLKDCDVTWLYGPLQRHRKGIHRPGTHAGGRLSTTSSFLNKKPILKKRSMSEIMLQKSLSASSLLKHAAAVIQAQRSATLTRTVVESSQFGRAGGNSISPSVHSRTISTDGTSAIPSTCSSGLQSPSTTEGRHIHFNNEVEQCIAVEIRDGDDDEDAENLGHALGNGSDDDSDDGVVMMRTASSAASSKVRISQQRPPLRTSVSADNKIIAMLPSTTLREGDDTPDPQESGQGRLSRSWTARKLSPSPSQETLRPPPRPTAHLYLDAYLGDGADAEEHVDSGREDRYDDGYDDGVGGGHDYGIASPLQQRRTSSTFTERFDHESFDSGHQGETFDARDDHDDDHNGLRRTASGMFMPIDDDEDDAVATGLFGRVIETVNTARDIAHVIWNVGWRR